MKSWIILASLLLPELAQGQDKEKDKDKAPQGFSFPSDLGGKKLMAMLQPGRPVDQKKIRTEPLPRRPLEALENPQARLPGFHALPPRLLLPATTLKAPRHPSEERPLARYVSEPLTPELVAFPVGPLWRWEMVDVNLPMPLPILAAPTKDRASLADPTAPTSIAAALAEVALGRTTPVPFAPVNLPDPFEHRQAIRLNNPPAELTQPAVPHPRLPNR